MRSVRISRGGSFLYRAFAYDGKFIEKSLHPRILVTALGLEVKLQRFGAARGTLTQIEALDGSKVEIPDRIATALEQVRTTHAEGRAFAVPATIGEADESDGQVGIWSYILYGRTLGIDQIDGELDRIDVRCERNRMQTRATQDKAWRIPEDWGGCWIYVSGKPGTTFRLVEHAAR